MTTDDKITWRKIFGKLFISKAEKNERAKRALAKAGFTKIHADKWVYQEGESISTPIPNAKGFFKNKTTVIGDVVFWSEVFGFRPTSDEMKSVEVRYKELVRLHPDDAGLHNNLGFILAKQDRFDEAKCEYQRAFSLEPNNAKLRNNLGFALYSYAQRLQGDADFFNDPNRKASLAKSARLYFAEAAEQFQEAARLAPSFLQYELHAALALFNAYQFDDAEKLFTLIKYSGTDETTRLCCDEFLQNIRQKRQTAKRVAD